MSKAADKHTGVTSAQRSPDRRLIPALLLLALSLAFLALRASQSARGPATERLLTLGDDVPLSPPPPLPRDDAAALRARLQPLEGRRPLLSDPSSDTRSLLTLAREAGMAGDNLLARDALKSALSRMERQDPAVVDALGRTCLDLALFREALEIYRSLRTVAPGSVRAYIGESRALAGLGRMGEATATLAHVSPSNAAECVELSAELLQRGDLPRALEAAQAALRIAPGEPRGAALAAARALYNLQRIEEARALTEPVVKRFPDDARARVLLASIINSPLAGKRRPDLAEHHLLSAAETAPDVIEPLERLGELYREQDRHRQAAFVYTRMLELNPASAEARMRLAAAYHSMSDARSAEQREIAERLVDRERREEKLAIVRNQKPTHPLPRLALARFYQEQGRYARAFAELQAAFAVSDGGIRIRSELTQLYARIGMTPPAFLREGIP